jgi:predicted transcriptional regulator
MEKYLAVIRVLDNEDSITQKQIIHKSNVKISSPKEILKFLVKQELIMEKSHGNKKVYSITNKGQKLSEYFRSNDDDSIFGGTNINRID